MKAPWERGRPARTNPGTASVISTTWINRERRPGSMLFPPTGWSIALKLSAGQAANAAGCQDRRWPSLRDRPGTGAGACLSRNKVRAGRPRSQGITPLLRESRGNRAEGRRLMRWGGGARPGNRFFSQLTSMHRMHRISRTKHWCRQELTRAMIGSAFEAIQNLHYFHNVGATSCPSWISFFHWCLSWWPFTDPFRVFSNPLGSLRGFIILPP